jgi:hypothetical protein
MREIGDLIWKLLYFEGFWIDKREFLIDLEFLEI